MKKSKRYRNVHFSADHIKEASETFEAQLSEKQREKLEANTSFTRYDETWSYDSEAEFFSQYRQGIESATYERIGLGEESPRCLECVSTAHPRLVSP